MPHPSAPLAFRLTALHARYDGHIPTAERTAARRRPPRGSESAREAAWAVVRYWAGRAGKAGDGSDPAALGWLRVALTEWQRARENAPPSQAARNPAAVYRPGKALY